jgi:uncharacterized OsmC-like protein
MRAPTHTGSFDRERMTTMATHVSSSDTKPARTPRPPLNGVNTPNLFATINFVADNPGTSDFTFRARNQWISGTHSRTEISGFYGAKGEQVHQKTFVAEGDHPTILTGTDNAPTPVEFLLHALAACLTAGIGNIAAARGVKLTKVTSTVEGQIDLSGLLGLSSDVRNGYRQIDISFEIEGDAPASKLHEIVSQSKARSAVFDVLTNGVPVNVEVRAVS